MMKIYKINDTDKFHVSFDVNKEIVNKLACMAYTNKQEQGAPIGECITEEDMFSELICAVLDRYDSYFPTDLF